MPMDHAIRVDRGRVALLPDPPARAEAARARGPGPALQPASPESREITAMKRPSLNGCHSQCGRDLDRLSCWVRSGCGETESQPGSPPAAAPSTSRSGSPRIALIMKSLANEFFKTMAEGAKKHQAEHASEYELIVNGIKDERNLSARWIWSRR